MCVCNACFTDDGRLKALQLVLDVGTGSLEEIVCIVDQIREKFLMRDKELLDRKGPKNTSYDLDHCVNQPTTQANWWQQIQSLKSIQ
jgi:hypothetical protein